MRGSMAPIVRPTRVLTWNVNGLRAVLQREKKKLRVLLNELQADVICFQETKLTRSELDEELVRPEGGGLRGIFLNDPRKSPSTAS